MGVGSGVREGRCLPGFLYMVQIQGVHKVRVHFNRACLFKVHTDFMDILYSK